MFGGKDPFDLNGDGKLDYRERAFKLDMEMNNFGDGPDGDGKGGLFGDDFEDEDDEDVESDLELDLELSGLDRYDLEDLDEDERREVLEDAGLDADDYDDFF